MFCKRCGKRVDTSASVCPHCGRDVDAVSGGTGFWDLMREASEPQGLQEHQVAPAPAASAPTPAPAQPAHVPPAHVPVGEVQSDLDEEETRVEPVVDEEDLQPTRAGDDKEKRRQAAGKRSAPKSRLAPIVIGVLAICALIVAVVLLVPRFSRTEERGQASEESKKTQTSTNTSTRESRASSSNDDKAKSGRFERPYSESGVLTIMEKPEGASDPAAPVPSDPADPSSSSSSSSSRGYSFGSSSSSSSSSSRGYSSGSSSNDSTSSSSNDSSSYSTSDGNRQSYRNQMSGQQ